MRPGNIIRLFLVVIATGGLFLVLRSNSPEKAIPSKSSCQESMDDCAHKEEGGGKTEIENLTHQFFSSF